MDKTAIKTYAVDARRKLIEAVKLKAQQLYIFEDSAKTLRPGTENELLQADGIFLSSEQLKSRERLHSELLHEDIPYKPAIYNRVMENVACTWFNRLIALRIMEVNDWLPSNIRILSSREPGRIEPDAVREVERLDYVSQSKVVELRADADINAAEKLYKYILISQCNALSTILPGMFQRENDYTELLLPDALLSKGGIVNDLVTLVHEDNFNVDEQGHVEIIGWLYQYYISEKKDSVFANKKDVKINKDTIPAITQLFTPEWIVKYMVENSLGRLWLTHCPPGMAHGNAEDALRELWSYYIEEAEQEDDVEKKLKELVDQFTFKDPTQIKLIDPCMGSGHVLVYAFDVLYQIYFSQGYSERDIPNLILQNNIYGLDIDDRAGQLAYFALMMKARSYNRRFFRQDSIPGPMVYAVPETKLYLIGLEKWLGANMSESDRKACFNDLKYLVELFAKGKEYGSLLKIERDIDFERLREYIHDFASGQIALDDADFIQQAENLDRLLDVAAMLSQKYDVVVTNPPYMAPAPSQADWIKKNYPDSKSDLCVVFIERNFELLKQSGYLSMITMHSWMFLSSFEKFRQKMIASKDIVNMAHLGARAFEEIGGEVVQTTTFTMRRTNVPKYLGTYARLVDYNSQQAKEEVFLAGDNRHTAKNEDFEKIPGWPVAYWVSEAMLRAFENGKLLEKLADTRLGMATANNNLFVRYWYEVSNQKIGFGCGTRDESIESARKWFPYNSGGEYRRWYGNFEIVVNWENDGFAIRNYSKSGDGKVNSHNYNLGYIFRECLTWSALSSSNFGIRYSPRGSLFDNAGSSLFSDTDVLKYLLGFLSSKITFALLKATSPTMNFQPGNIASLPVIVNRQRKSEIDSVVFQNIAISRTDWDSFETSWDFKRHPLI